MKQDQPEHVAQTADVSAERPISSANASTADRDDAIGGQDRFEQPIRWLRTEAWDSFPGLTHGFSYRLPKTTQPLDAASVCASLGVPQARLHTLKQVHGSTVVRVTSERPGHLPHADGMLTTQPQAFLGIATADCVPILLIAPKKRLAGALHAGWRGTQQAICLRGVERCAELWQIAPDQLWAALGPSIDGCCYEVGREVGEPLAGRWDAERGVAWRRSSDKGYLDLRLINRVQLLHAGLPAEQIQRVGGCTSCRADEFASYRREGARAGRQLSIIGWNTRTGGATSTDAA